MLYGQGNGSVQADGIDKLEPKVILKHDGTQLYQSSKGAGRLRPHNIVVPKSTERVENAICTKNLDNGYHSCHADDIRGLRKRWWRLLLTGGSSKASGQIVFWGWGNGIKETVAAFEKANPDIKVKYNNTGTAGDTQVALSNAVAAGKGVPDVTMLEDPTVEQFAIEDNLEDLTQFGGDKFADDFASGP